MPFSFRLVKNLRPFPKYCTYNLYSITHVTARCARDLVKGDISCLLALEEWQEQSAQGPVESSYLIEEVLNEGPGRRRIFG